jgi:four helix bundle protein
MNREKSQSYRDLLVWQKAMDLVDHVYDLALLFPPDERFALTPQLKRAVVSVPANIAEGQGRATRRDFANFLTIARSSVLEVETLLSVAQRRGFITDEKLDSAFLLTTEVGKMLFVLRKRIKED